MANEKVSFYKGKLDDYESLKDKKSGAIYFAEEGVIMLEDQEYVRYNPSDTIAGKTTETAIGGIAANTKVEDLKGKSFSALFDTLLFPVKQPKVKTRNSITWEKGQTKTVRLGTALIEPSAAIYNPGEWENGNGTFTPFTRPGNKTTYTYNINGKSYDNSSNPTGTPIITGVDKYNKLAANSYKAEVFYLAGGIPVDGNGVEVPEKQESSGTMTSEFTIYVTVPYYTSTTLGTEKEGDNIQDVHKAECTAFITIPAGTKTNKQWFSIPGTIKNLQQENPISGKYEDVTHTVGIEKGWKPIKEEKIFSGITIDYNKYVWYGTVRDVVKLKVTFNVSE